MLMRRLSSMSEASIGDVKGPGRVVVTQRDQRRVVALTDAGKRIAVGPSGALAEPGSTAGPR
ncbi:MAG: hypothetical protein ABI781_01045 [Burkholderiales bacterium]